MVWDLIEISCSLAVSCIFPCKRESRKFDNDCYKKATQMRFYAAIVIPMDEHDCGIVRNYFMLNVLIMSQKKVNYPETEENNLINLKS